MTIYPPQVIDISLLIIPRENGIHNMHVTMSAKHLNIAIVNRLLEEEWLGVMASISGLTCAVLLHVTVCELFI